MNNSDYVIILVGGFDMSKFKLNSTNDAVFKAVFAKHPNITLALINAFFEFQGTELISEIESTT